MAVSRVQKAKTPGPHDMADQRFWVSTYIVKDLSKMSSESVSVENPIRIYPDGATWCALWGQDIMEGLSGFGRTPETALSQLLEQENLWENTPHGVWDLTCPDCEHHAVHVMPFPFPQDSIKCHACGSEMPVSSDPSTLN
jgi:ribosomal protein S27E